MANISQLVVKGKPFPSLIDVTIDEVITGLDSGLFTSVDLVKAYLARIEQVNPIVNAVTEVNPEALEIAKLLDTERAAKKVRGCVHMIEDRCACPRG
jgi:amidase